MEKFDFEKYDFDRSLLFVGPTGVGKTYKANELIKKWKYSQAEKNILTSYEITDAKFKQFVKDNYLHLRKPEDYQCSYEYYPLELMLRCKVLLYDDIGVSDISEAYLRDFTFIIDERIKNGFITIFTSNLSKKELSEKLNERIVSRILFNTDVVVFSGEDRRLMTTNYYEV